MAHLNTIYGKKKGNNHSSMPNVLSEMIHLYPCVTLVPHGANPGWAFGFDNCGSDGLCESLILAVV